MSQEIAELEMQLYELTHKLNALKKESEGEEVPNYTFRTISGEVTLKDLFAGKDRLLLIHNMGQACRFCTLWGDGFNGFVPHLENALSLVMVSKDDPATQQTFANSRGWRFRMASHGGGDYIKEQTAMPGQANMPGAVAYRLEGDKILRMNSGIFGPGDLYCSAWNLLGLAGIGEAEWTPQYRYWSRSEKMEDGGENVID